MSVKKKCVCKQPNIRPKTTLICKNCGGVRESILGSIGYGFDECGSHSGITDFAGRFKIWSCDHFIYCPLCNRRVKTVEELKQHIEGWNETDDRRFCDGVFLYGQYAADEVINEIKYYALYKNKEVKKNG